MKRVVTLIPSATEIVAALGALDWITGRSHECDFPDAVAGQPALTRPAVPLDGNSRAIDLAVKDRLQRALAVYEVDGPGLKMAAPDVIVTQSQCDVCAVSLADVETAVAVDLDRPVTILSLEPRTVNDVWADIERVGAALGKATEAGVLAMSLRDRMAMLSAQAGTIPVKPKVACIEWIDPPMIAGNWVPELVRAAGGEPVLAPADGEHASWIAWDDVVAADPDVIVFMPCGFDIRRTCEELPVLTTRGDWSSLRAVREREIVVTDGNQYFNRPGPRLIDSAEILAEVLHPERFSFGFKGVGWERL